MTEVLLFHHIQGLTEGVRAFADELRTAGHTVHTPDLYGGKTLASIEEGFEFQKSVDAQALADAAAAELPSALVYAGFSWGVMQAQRLVQTRAGARGALLYESCVPITGDWAFGPWPDGVPVQIHMMDADPWGDEDRPAAEALVAEVQDAELFLYPGSGHLFADPSIAGYDGEASALLTDRTLAFLERVG